MANQKTLVITQVRGNAGKTKRQKQTLRALGLRRSGQSTEKADGPVVRGMIEKISHLVKVEEK
jgi:large subunit ribosomal protein L30